MLCAEILKLSVSRLSTNICGSRMLQSPRPSHPSINIVCLLHHEVLYTGLPLGRFAGPSTAFKVVVCCPSAYRVVFSTVTGHNALLPHAEAVSLLQLACYDIACPFVTHQVLRVYTSIQVGGTCADRIVYSNKFGIWHIVGCYACVAGQSSVGVGDCQSCHCRTRQHRPLHPRSE